MKKSLIVIVVILVVVVSYLVYRKFIAEPVISNIRYVAPNALMEVDGKNFSVSPGIGIAYKQYFIEFDGNGAYNQYLSLKKAGAVVKLLGVLSNGNFTAYA